MPIASIVDAPYYPWSDPVAQQLHVVLCTLYPTSKGAF
jgi:hypothetical protein